MWKFTVLLSRRSIQGQSPLQKPPTHELHHHWQSCETFAAVFSLFSLIPATFDYELRYSSLRSHDNCVSNSISDIYRWLVLVLTLTSVLFLTRGYLLKRQWLLGKFSRSSHSQQLLRMYKNWKWLSLRLMGEILVLAIFPYPGLEEIPVLLQERQMVCTLPCTDPPSVFPFANYCILLSEILYCFMVIRIFFLVRALVNYSVFADSTARRICSQYQEMADFSFNVKAMARKWPFRFVLAQLAFTILLRTLERPYSSIVALDWDQVLNSMWYTVTTLDVAPYGDYYINTHINRIFAFFLAILSLAVVSVAYSLVSDMLDFSTAEMDVYEQIRTNRMAVKVIETWYLYEKSRKTKPEKHSLRLYFQFCKALEVFSYEIPLLSHTVGLSEREISEKYQQLVDLNYAMGRIDSKFSTAVAKIDKKLTKAKTLLRRIEKVVGKSR